MARSQAAYGWATLVALGLGLAACQGLEAPSAKFEAPGVPVALDTIEGAPDAVKTRMSAEVTTQATPRKIELVDNGAQPRYRLKGYLTAYPTETGDTALAVVWDVFDSSNKRAQRVTTTTVAKGQGEDPWSRIGETQIAKATSQSMNQVAAFLSGATAPGSAETDSASGAAEPSKALGYAAQ